MTAAKAINGYMEAKGIKRSFIARQIGMPPELLGRTLDGKRKLKADEFLAICEVLSLDMEYFKKTKSA